MTVLLSEDVIVNLIGKIELLDRELIFLESNPIPSAFCLFKAGSNIQDMELVVIITSINDTQSAGGGTYINSMELAVIHIVPDMKDF